MQLAELVNDPQRPVQFIFAGKAHPADEPGKYLIKKIENLRHDRRFAGRIVFIEDYDINVARHLVQGVDVWLNTPRRPKEASGTSGMKAVLNGGLNLSILDGWWAEAYNGKNGFAIGDGRQHVDDEITDDRDAQNLINALRDEVIPLYYDRDADGLPRQWIQMMVESIATLAAAVQRPSHGAGLRPPVLPGRRRRPELGNEPAVTNLPRHYAETNGCIGSNYQPEDNWVRAVPIRVRSLLVSLPKARSTNDLLIVASLCSRTTDAAINPAARQSVIRTSKAVVQF